MLQHTSQGLRLFSWYFSGAASDIQIRNSTKCSRNCITWIKDIGVPGLGWPSPVFQLQVSISLVDVIQTAAGFAVWLQCALNRVSEGKPIDKKTWCDWEVSLLCKCKSGESRPEIESDNDGRLDLPMRSRRIVICKHFKASSLADVVHPEFLMILSNDVDWRPYAVIDICYRNRKRAQLKAPLSFVSWLV